MINMNFQQILTERTQKVEKMIADILLENNLKLDELIDFPTYKVYPDEVKLALMVLERHGAKIMRSYQLLDEKKEIPAATVAENV